MPGPRSVSPRPGRPAGPAEHGCSAGSGVRPRQRTHVHGAPRAPPRPAERRGRPAPHAPAPRSAKDPVHARLAACAPAGGVRPLHRRLRHRRCPARDRRGPRGLRRRRRTAGHRLLGHRRSGGPGRRCGAGARGAAPDLRCGADRVRGGQRARRAHAVLHGADGPAGPRRPGRGSGDAVLVRRRGRTRPGGTTRPLPRGHLPRGHRFHHRRGARGDLGRRSLRVARHLPDHGGAGRCPLWRS